MAAVSDPSATTEDAFLGGRLVVCQPRAGHRAGLEAVLMAAAAPVGEGQTVLDIGAGVGVAGLCVLARCPSAHAVLVEVDAEAAALARGNVERNGLRDRATVVDCDVEAAGAARRAGLDGVADHAIANPPFYDPLSSRTAEIKARAHAARADTLDLWTRFAAAAVKSGGTFTLIHRAEALPEVLAAFGRRFGEVGILPIHPRPGAPATRILVQGRKGARGPLRILAGLTLHGDDGHDFTPQMEAVLRHGAPLGLVSCRS